MASYIPGLDPAAPLERCAARAVSEVHALTLTDDELLTLAGMLLALRAATLDGTLGPLGTGITTLVVDAADRLPSAAVRRARTGL